MEREPSDGTYRRVQKWHPLDGIGTEDCAYFTDRQHASENLAEVLKRRAAELASPIQTFDALSRNTPRLTNGVEILLANCLAHGRRDRAKLSRGCRLWWSRGQRLSQRCRGARTETVALRTV
jgi:hypothetical protein